MNKGTSQVQMMTHNIPTPYLYCLWNLKYKQRIIYSQDASFLEQNNLLSKSQSSFRETPAFYFANDILVNMDERLGKSCCL